MLIPLKRYQVCSVYNKRVAPYETDDAGGNDDDDDDNDEREFRAPKNNGRK